MSQTIAPDRIDPALLQAGVVETTFTSATLTLSERTGLSIVRVHGPGDLPQRHDLPVALSSTTGQCAGQDPTALCIGPGDWLLISETRSPASIIEPLQRAVATELCSVFDLSHGLAAFRLSGPGAAWLLSKLSGLDFLAASATGEHCARTKMQHLAVVVHYHEPDGNQVFDLLFDRSVARYFWELLIASAPHADDLSIAFGASQ